MVCDDIHKRKMVAKQMHYSPSPLTAVVTEDSVDSRDVSKGSLLVAPRYMTLLLITISSHLSWSKEK